MSTAIVTGASRGIGRQIAHRLGELGWNLGLIATDERLLREAASSIGARADVQIVLEPIDVGDYGQASGAVERIVAAVGTPSLLVNNAGRIDAEVPVWEADPAQLAAVVSTNVLGSLFMERAVLPHMVAAGRGRVINLVSGAGARSWGLAPAYTTSKAAQLRNIGDLAEVGEGVGIYAFGLAPGVVRTDMTAGMDLHEGRSEYTPVSATLDLVEAIAAGSLDAWSGAYLRADVDTPESLTSAAQAKNEHARHFGVFPWGEGDPLG